MLNINQVLEDFCVGKGMNEIAARMVVIMALQYFNECALPSEIEDKYGTFGLECFNKYCTLDGETS